MRQSIRDELQEPVAEPASPGQVLTVHDHDPLPEA